MPRYEGISSLGLINEKHTTVVIDFGHAYTKVGFAGETGPRAIIPSVRYNTNNEPEKIFDYKDTTQLRRNLVEFVDKIYFKHLLVNPKDRRVVIVENLLSPTIIRDTLAKVLFLHYEVLSVLFLPSHLVSLMTLGKNTGLVVDLGYKETSVIPVYEGVPILCAWQSLALGGQAIHKSLESLLLERAVSLGPDKKEERLSNVVDHLPEQVLEDIKVRTCFITTMERKDKLLDNKYDRSIEPPPPPPNVEYPFKSNRRITIPGSVREMAPEILFEVDRDNLSVPTMIMNAIYDCPVDTRKSLAENIVIIGGTANIKGLKHRILEEVRILAQTKEYQEKMKIELFKIHSPPAKDNYVSWLGAAIFANTEAVAMRSLLKDVYVQTKTVPDWCNLAYNTKDERKEQSA